MAGAHPESNGSVSRERMSMRQKVVGAIGGLALVGTSIFAGVGAAVGDPDSPLTITAQEFADIPVTTEGYSSEEEQISLLESIQQQQYVNALVAIGKQWEAQVAAANVGGRFDILAACESTSDWHINSGNGFFGGLQFTQETWEAIGGLMFAPRADLATREQQIIAASWLLADSGWVNWPVCSVRTGLADRAAYELPEAA